MNKELLEKRRANMAKARAALAEKRQAEEAMVKETPATSFATRTPRTKKKKRRPSYQADGEFIKAAAKKLAKLYHQQDAIAAKIAEVEAEIDSGEFIPTTRRPGVKRGFQKPSLDILELVPTKGSITLQEAVEASQEKYGGRYTYGAVVSSLRRLTLAGVLTRDESGYFRTR